MTRACTALVWACVLAATPVSAHRLDEYLQASRLSLGPGPLTVELDLTPGAAIADQIAALIDTNGDGQWSRAEQDAYAAAVIANTVLEIDRRSAPLVLIDSQFPTLDEMRAGTGAIRLRARGGTVAMSEGRHEVRYFNVHRPEVSVYLINALVPPPGIEITAQRRDPFQHELTLDYVVSSSGSVTWTFVGIVAVLATLGSLFVGRSFKSAV